VRSVDLGALGCRLHIGLNRGGRSNFWDTRKVLLSVICSPYAWGMICNAGIPGLDVG
jgi:hypothetical protein